MTNKTVVVLGGGVGGLSVANDLRRRLGWKQKVSVVDKTGEHVFWQSLRWLQVGLREPNKITKELEKLLKSRIDFARGEVDLTDPVAMRARLGGKTFDADYLTFGPVFLGHSALPCLTGFPLSCSVGLGPVLGLAGPKANAT